MSDEAETRSHRCARYKIRSNQLKQSKESLIENRRRMRGGKYLNAQKHPEIII
jgi:hypothetical protein